MRVAPLEEQYLDDVSAMEKQDGDVHWSRAQFERELESEVIRFFVVLSSDVRPIVLGYGGYRVAGTEAQITNLVVRRDARCRGIGRHLLEFLVDCARGESCSSCTLEVRATNARAQRLYQKLGYEVQGTRSKMYQDPEEDGVLMEKRL